MRIKNLYISSWKHFRRTPDGYVLDNGDALYIVELIRYEHVIYGDNGYVNFQNPIELHLKDKRLNNTTKNHWCGRGMD